MNSLSWFIYLTGIADNVVLCCAIILFIGVFIGIIGAIFMAIEWDDALSDWPKKSLIKYYFITMAVTMVVGSVVPSRKTLLLIAASEIGQTAVNSKTAQDVIDPGMDLLKTWIKRETEKLAKEVSK